MRDVELILAERGIAVTHESVRQWCLRLGADVARMLRRFLSSHAMIYGHFRPRRHLLTAARYRRARAEVFWVWREETCVRMAS